ncbi:hypothetical protein NCER_102625 [Vairimorpha ceranae BRL01]|uniref:Uncharacterized protein n=1 Tax=Vairimorpha ceranae (strain BRL01) TaxID=578460 RepID=C4VCA5_VAIC1|nr:hypothetical protein NCER_102625 [Vairimorpha ceranae BRL01]
MFILFYLSDKPLIRYLIKRLLYSKISDKKILFLEILFSIGVIKRTNINRFLDYIPDRSQNYVFITLNDSSYITKLNEPIMNVELEDRTSFEYIYFYIIIYFELEMYVDKCGSAKDKSSTLLENYYKLLEVKNFCKDFEHCSKTTVDNICHIYYGLNKKS